MAKLDKLTDIAGAASNPLSAANQTLEAARGVVSNGYGLVNDIRGIVEQEKARKENGLKKLFKKAFRTANDAAEDYNDQSRAHRDLLKQVLIERKLREEEEANVAGLNFEERKLYLKKLEEIRRERERHRLEVERREKEARIASQQRKIFFKGFWNFILASPFIIFCLYLILFIWGMIGYYNKYVKFFIVSWLPGLEYVVQFLRNHPIPN